MERHKMFVPRTGSAGSIILDASETTLLAGELEYIDKKVYMQPYLNGKAMSILPQKSDIPAWAKMWTWRESDAFGKARLGSAGALQDIPRVDVTRKEFTKTIRDIQIAYSYTWAEMQYSAMTDTRLDADRAVQARFGAEDERDRVLSYGDATFGLDGLLTVSGVLPYTLSDKAAGGKAWGTIAVPRATGREVCDDLVGFATNMVDNSQGKVQAVQIYLTVEAYSYAQYTPVNALSSVSALQAALASPYILSIEPWYRCKAANSGGALANDTMVGLVPNDEFVCAVNPLNWTIMPAQLNGLEWVIPGMLRTGGVVLRHTYAVSRATGFGA